MPNGMYVRGMNPAMMSGRAAPYPNPAMHMAQKRTGQFPGAMPAQVRRRDLGETGKVGEMGKDVMGGRVMGNLGSKSW